MNVKTFDRILETQERISKDPERQNLLAEHELLNTRFLEQLETMTKEQRETVMDYFGLIIELHLRTVTALLEEEERGESE